MSSCGGLLLPKQCLLRPQCHHLHPTNGDQTCRWCKASITDACRQLLRSMLRQIQYATTLATSRLTRSMTRTRVSRVQAPNSIAHSAGTIDSNLGLATQMRS